MKNKLPINNLLLSSVFLAFYISFFLLISTFMEGSGYINAVKRCINCFVSFILVSMGNISLLMLFKTSDEALRKKHRFGLVLLSFMSSVIIINIIRLINHYLVLNLLVQPSPDLHVNGNWIYLYTVIQAILLNSLILLIQGFTIIQDANNKARIENLLLKSVKSEAAYELLLQQIHPHFLFNALNILKTLIKNKPLVAEDYLVRLSFFLRSSLKQNKSGTSPLSDELKLCINYLEMQKIRFGTALTYAFDLTNEDHPKCMLPVFSLQSLLENAIKHNELTESEPLHIDVRQHEEWITVSNNIQLKSTSPYSMGNGLTNLAERYELLNEDEIKINNTGTTFSVSLKILKVNY